MVTALIHLDPKQKRRLARRAEMRGSSLSQEVRTAIGIYLALPVENEDELKLLARAANRSSNSTIKKLDETIAYVDRVLKEIRKSECSGLPKLLPFRKI
jgi:hypothetical protein